MKRCLVKSLKLIIIAIVFSTVFSNDLKAVDQDVLQTEQTDTVSVELPTEEKISPFNFILDPQMLITETDGAKYGANTFEAGATLYFENTDGDYNFSSRSDMLTVKNKGAVPVKVTVTAWLGQIDNLSIVQSDSFEDEAASIFLAVVDSEGNIQPLDENGMASVTAELHDKYSFGLVGACNPNGIWMDLDVHPTVTVTWQVTPVADKEELQEELEDMQEDPENIQEEQEEEASGEEIEDMQGEQKDGHEKQEGQENTQREREKMMEE